MARHSGLVARWKTKRKRAGATSCDCCSWHPPVGLIDLGQTDGFRLMHAHHVFPISCGGEDVEANMVLLCPNCHAVAHRLGTISPAKGQWPEFAWDGPRTPTELLRDLKLLVIDPDGWREYHEMLRSEARSEARAREAKRQESEAVGRRLDIKLVSGR